MNRLPAFLLTAWALAACATPPSSDSAANGAPIVSDEVTLFVAGLSCPN